MSADLAGRRFDYVANPISFAGELLARVEVAVTAARISVPHRGGKGTVFSNQASPDGITSTGRLVAPRVASGPAGPRLTLASRAQFRLRGIFHFFLQGTRRQGFGGRAPIAWLGREAKKKTSG